MSTISSGLPQSEHLKGTDLDEGAAVTLTMERIGEVEVPDFNDETKKIKKLALFFANKAKSLILNKCNGEELIKMHGDDREAIVGKEVVLYRTSAKVKGEVYAALRLRAPNSIKSSADVPF